MFSSLWASLFLFFLFLLFFNGATLALDLSFFCFVFLRLIYLLQREKEPTSGGSWQRESSSRLHTEPDVGLDLDPTTHEMMT